MILQVRPCLIIKSPLINYDFNKKLHISSKFGLKFFSEIESLFHNSWPFYDKTSWLPVTPFFHAFYYVLGVVFQKIAAASHPFSSRKMIRYECRKDIFETN